ASPCRSRPDWPTATPLHTTFPSWPDPAPTETASLSLHDALPIWRALEHGDLPPQAEFVRRRERQCIVLGLDPVQACVELQLAVYETLHVGARERLLYARQPFRIAEAARFQHVAEDVDALPPVLQVARQEPEVAIVLERLLELVRGEKMVEVARLHALRQRFELPVPAGG